MHFGKPMRTKNAHDGFQVMRRERKKPAFSFICGGKKGHLLQLFREAKERMQLLFILLLHTDHAGVHLWSHVERKRHRVHDVSAL